MAATYSGLQDTPTPSIVFTDDLAPIEGITNSMVLHFLLTDQVDNLK